MPMRIDDKKLAVKELNEIADKAVSAIAADYHGTSVSELTKLREEARNSSVHLKVIRNTLAKRALSGTKFSCFDELLVGPTILAFSLDDHASAAKLANNFNKVNSNFIVKGLSMGDSLLELSRLSDIANLPNKEEAIAQLAGLLNAPLVKLVSLMNEIPSKLTRTLAEVRQQKIQAES
ncbi:MAG: 50S ribosomal protein L10 [Gammaproteobacteria bacterium]|nr:MAG: 50S ribosomal protein L10 [Gammaproteobacteria bacterium]